jgi:hypothetical protein
MTARSRNGEASPTTADATMMAMTTPSCTRYGMKSWPIRRSETSRAWVFSMAVTVWVSRRRTLRPTSRSIAVDVDVMGVSTLFGGGCTPGGTAMAKVIC